MVKKLIILVVIIALVQNYFGEDISSQGTDAITAAQFVKNTISVNEILYFGDSVLVSASKTDSDTRSIPAYLSEALGRKVTMVNHSAYHIGVYLQYVKYLVRHNLHPSLIILPVNMRSFSPEWDTRPSYQFEKDYFILRHGAKSLPAINPLTVLNFFADSSNQDWLKMPVYDVEHVCGKVNDFQGGPYSEFSDKNMRNKIIFQYRYKLNESHRKVRDLAEIANLCRLNKIRLICYVTPIDILSCEQFYPKTSEIIRDNVNVIVALLGKKNIPVLDLSARVMPEDFDWKANIYPNEHLREKGRKYVASKLVSFIAK